MVEFVSPSREKASLGGCSVLTLGFPSRGELWGLNVDLRSLPQGAILYVWVFRRAL